MRATQRPPIVSHFRRSPDPPGRSTPSCRRGGCRGRRSILPPALRPLRSSTQPCPGFRVVVSWPARSKPASHWLARAATTSTFAVGSTSSCCVPGRSRPRSARSPSTLERPFRSLSASFSWSKAIQRRPSLVARTSAETQIRRQPSVVRSPVPCTAFRPFPRSGSTSSARPPRSTRTTSPRGARGRSVAADAGNVAAT